MQPGNIPSVTLPPEDEITPGERRGSAIAHGSGLLIGLPIVLLSGWWFGMPAAFGYISSPIVCYLIARSFRRRQKAWGSFQGIQATVAHLLIVFFLFPFALGAATPVWLSIVPLILFLYTLWGAWDVLFGEDFRYIGINRLLRHVANVNLQRQEQRRRFGQPYSVDRPDRDDERRG